MMSWREKYGNFSISGIIFYDEIERDHFAEVVDKTYKNYISKINGKKVIGHGKFKRPTDEEKMYLKIMNMQIWQDDSMGITDIVGYGHRNLIFPLEMWVRHLFDEGRIVSYEARDNCNRSYEPSDEDIKDEMGDFLREKKRRIELFNKGELEPPRYRQGQNQSIKK